MPKYSLVGYDGSDAARRAFAFAMELARACGGRVRVVSVLQVVEGGDTCALMMTDSGTQRMQELKDELATIAADAASLADIELTHGSPGDVLLGQVAQHGIDHNVIGHTERGALSRGLLGSASTNVLAGAHVQVTVVR